MHCRTKDENFSLNLGLLDFGAAYLFVITNVSSLWPPSLSPSIYLYIYIYITLSISIYKLHLSVSILGSKDSVERQDHVIISSVR